MNEGLTILDDFTLGVALYLCNGEKEDRRNWFDREKVDFQELMQRRRFTPHEIEGLKKYCDELRRGPVLREGPQTKA